jgi:outer membrane biosynthesis protein TonB
MGEVYLAEDPHIDRQLALKTVRLGDGGEIEIEERRVRLMREAKAAGRLVHPYVVTLFDAGEAEEGIFYLAFEFVGGPDLSKRQQMQPPLTLGEVLRIGRQSAEGLDAAHRQGIVHRDIKPSNILLDSAGQVKITDFGIAKMLGQATELTQTGSVVGSPHYLSPEQIRGEELDGRSDLFSLGVVLYELLTRTRPFSGDTITTLVYQILAREPQSILGMRPGLPERVERVVTRLLSKDRDQRFASGRELADELAACERELSPEILATPAAALPDEMGATVVMGTPTPGTGALPPPPSPPPRPATGATELWAQGVAPPPPPVRQGTGPTQLWQGSGPGGPPPPPPPFGQQPGASAGALPYAGGPAIAGGSAVPGSGSYGPAAAPRRFPWVVVVALVVLLLLGGGALVGVLWWLGRGGDEQAAIAAGAEGSEAVDPTTAGDTDATMNGEPAADDTFAGVDESDTTADETGDVAADFSKAGSRGTGVLHSNAPQPEPPAPPPVADEPVAPLHRGTPVPIATPPPAPRPAPTQAPRPRPTEPAPAPAPPPEPEPEPEPAAPEQRYDRQMSSSLSIKFAVEPPETVVSVKREGDRRFTVIGRAGDYDAEKRRLPAYDLNGAGVHYVRFVHEGREVIYRLDASLGNQITTVTVNLAPAGRGR